MAPTPDQTILAGKLARQAARAEAPHKKRRDYFQACRDSYLARLKPTESQWRSDLHPPFVWQYIETILASIVDEPSDPVVEPLGEKDSEIVKKVENAMTVWEDADHFAENWPRFVRSGLVHGIAIGKDDWQQQYRTVKKRTFKPVPGLPIPIEGPSKMVRELALDQPHFEVIDPDDFWWNEDARCIEEWTCVYFRTFQTMSALKALEEEGIYQNIDQLSANAGNAPVPNDGQDSSGSGPTRKPGSVEVLEIWTNDHLWVLADRKVLIRDEPNPLGTGQIPFVGATPLPKDGEVVGWSMAEILGEMQCAAWDAMNHRTDNAKILSNAVLKVRDGMPDQDSLGERFPGQRVIVSNIAADIAWDQPPVSIIEPLIEAEQRINQTMMDLSGAVAYLSGAGEGTVDQSTATGISIIQSTAQKRLLFMKQEYANADNRRGQQWIDLGGRLMSSPVPFANQTAGEYEFDALWPHELANLKCRYRVSDVAESLNQQQKRSEAILKLNTLMAVAAIPTMTPMINLRRAVEDFSEAFGDDREAFLNGELPQPPMGMGLPTGPGGSPLPMMGPGQPTPGLPAGASSAPPTPLGAPPYVNNAPNQQPAA